MFIIKSKLKLRYKHNCLYIAEGIINDKLLLWGAHLLPDLLLHLEAVLFVLLIALLHRLVAADVLLDGVAHGAQLLALAVLAHLPHHGLALLVVDVLLGLLGAGAGLQLALLHRLGVAVLLLHGEGELVGELLAVPAGLGLADLPGPSWGRRSTSWWASFRTGQLPCRRRASASCSRNQQRRYRCGPSQSCLHPNSTGSQYPHTGSHPWWTGPDHRQCHTPGQSPRCTSAQCRSRPPSHTGCSRPASTSARSRRSTPAPQTRR